MKLSRENAQLASIVLIALGVFVMWTTPHMAPGVSFIGMSCWIMLISESVLLTRVQNEMTTALEGLRKKQEIEVQDLLFYLRQSKLGNSPWSNLDAARNHINKIGFPAIITDPGGACLAVNPPLYDALGIGKDFVGELCHGLHVAESYGEYVQGISTHISKGNRFMHSRLIMIDIDGKEHKGTVAITMLPDLRTAVGIWYPDDKGILQTV
jgi:hypothetical protein